MSYGLRMEDAMDSKLKSKPPEEQRAIARRIAGECHCAPAAKCGACRLVYDPVLAAIAEAYQRGAMEAGAWGLALNGQRGAPKAQRGSAEREIGGKGLDGRITITPGIFGGKPSVRGRRLAVEHVLAMLAAGDSLDDLQAAYPWLEREDVLACLDYASRAVANGARARLAWRSS